MNVWYHNKGMDLLNLPQILNCKKVMMAVPNYLRNTPPPVVSYTYTKTITGKIFNHRKVVEELDMDNGTDDIECSCSSSSNAPINVSPHPPPSRGGEAKLGI